VIAAVNADVPFDQFTISQLAGDLLPNATPEQKLATAFHRQTLTNTEGGVDQEQFRNEAVFDRTETTGTVWLGLTVGCARCHTRKCDQISQREYCQLFAFYNNADETLAKVVKSAGALAEYEKANAAHLAKLREAERTVAAARESLKDRLPALEKELHAKLASLEGKKPERKVLELSSVNSEAKATFTKLDDGSWLTGGTVPKQDTCTITAKLPAATVSAVVLEVMPDESLPAKGPGWGTNGNFVLSEFRVQTKAGAKIEMHSPKADCEQAGWKVGARSTEMRRRAGASAAESASRTTRPSNSRSRSTAQRSARRPCRSIRNTRRTRR
jgi:hypothetical protein